MSKSLLKKLGIRRPFFKATAFEVARPAPDMDWGWADARSIDASLSFGVRERIRNRARSEIANNSYAMGAGLSIVNAVIPNAPRLQFIPKDKKETSVVLANEIERDFSDWAKEVGLAQKLRAMRFAKFQDGETFAILHENAQLENPVKLDFSPIDCDRVKSNIDAPTSPTNIDGVKLDDWGNAVEYNVLSYHPGDVGTIDASSKQYPAKRVLHWFRKLTPEQHRGVSELAPSLVLFSYLRRYTTSVVRASEVCADLALVLKSTDANANGYEDDDAPIDNPVLEVPFSRGMAVTLPDGFDASQIKAEQPTAQFSTLVDELLGAIGASLGLPRLIMRKSATGFNYASARVDLSEMERFISIERDELNNNIVDKIFNSWLKEWELVNKKKAPAGWRQWYYAESIGSRIDPQKEANAQKTRLENQTSTLAREYAKQGLDWENELEQLAIEKRKKQELSKKYQVDLTGASYEIQND